MVDFSEALKAHIESMTPDELSATEIRRLSRQADENGRMVLEARCQPAPGGKGVPTTKDVTVKVDPAPTPGAAEILRMVHGSVHESIILVPAVYRAIAGGPVDPAAPTTQLPQDFVVNPGGPGYERVIVDRDQLAAIIANERPQAMARARRLVEQERRNPTSSYLPIDRRTVVFEEKWESERINLAIDVAISTLTSRAVMLIAGKDHIALWVRKEDLTVGPGRILGSALAAAIVRPERPQTLPNTAGPGGHYLQNTFGSGPERTLVLDVARIRKAIPAMPQKEARDLALALFETLINRSAALARERAARDAVGTRADHLARG